MKYVLTLLLALFALPAFAVGIGNDNPPGGYGTRIDNDTRANAAAWQSQKQFVAQQQTVNVATPAPAPQPVTVNNNLPATPAVTRQEIHQDAINVRTVPNVLSGNVYPTAPCMGSSTVGAAALGWGASVGTSWADHECGKRETARSFQNLGLTADALAVLCSSEYAAAAPSCKGN